MSHVDEPFIQDENVLTQMVARIREPRSKIKELLLTGTPEQLNWGYDIAEGDRRDDFDIGVIHASTRANLAVDTTYADTLEKALDPVSARAYVSGEFVDTQHGAVYYSFDRTRNVKRIEIPGDAELSVGMDFNVNPMASMIFWYNKRDNFIYYIEEIELPNADTEYLCGYLIDEYIHKKNYKITTVYPDATGIRRSTNAPGGKSDFWYLEQAGFEIDAPPKNPIVRDRENSVNGGLCPKKGNPRIFIHPRCKRLISYCVKYTHEVKGKEEGKKMSHLLDAFGYPVHRIMPIVKPVISKQATVVGI